MKLTHKLTLSLLSLGLASTQAAEIVIPGMTPSPSAAPSAAAPAAPGAPASPGAPTAAPAAAPVNFTNAQLVEEFGWFIGKRLGLSDLEFSPDEVTGFVKGVQAAAAGKEAPYELEKAGPLMDELMQKKQAAYFEKMKTEAIKKNDAFFAKVEAENKALQKTPSGLRFQITQPGTGPLPGPTDTVKVHYTGALSDGTVFDSSVQRGQPLDIPLDQVVKGWSEGVQKVGKGGKVKLYIPPDIGYGDQGQGDIPPFAVLVFDVEVLDIVPATPAPTAPGAAPAPTAPAPSTAK